MKTLFTLLALLVSSSALAAPRTITGAEVLQKFQAAMGGQSSVQGQLIDKSECSVAIEIGRGRSQGINTIVIKSHLPFPINAPAQANFTVETETTREGVITETFRNSFGGVQQTLSLTNVAPGLFIARAKVIFREQGGDSADCFVAVRSN